MKDRMTFDEAVAVATEMDSAPADVLMAIYEDKMLDIFNMVLLELQFRNAKGIAFNKVYEEVERLKARRAQREEARKQVLAAYRSQKGAS